MIDPEKHFEEDSTREPALSQPDDLHDLFQTSVEGSEEEDPLAHLRNDPNYAALIQELEYIAKQARLLFEPAEEAPSDEVWAKIQKELEAKSSDPASDPNQS